LHSNGRVNPEQLDELARLADIYGNGEIRLTIGQNAIIPECSGESVAPLLEEPLLKQFSPRPLHSRADWSPASARLLQSPLIETKSAHRSL